MFINPISKKKRIQCTFKESQSVVGKFKHLVQSNEEVIISGEGSQLRDYLYVHDLPKAIHKIIYSSASGIFNLSSGKSLTIKKILNLAVI